MSFNSLSFLIFLPIVLLGYWILPQKFRWIWLLIASYYFYLSWNIELGFLIVGTTLVSYLGGILIDKIKNRKWQKAIMIICICICLGVLFVFKYLDFLLDSIYYFVKLANPTFDGVLLNLILPVGISFYTFQTLSYVIDVYRGTIKAEYHLGYYALFVSYFPQLVAGPIERPENLLPQLKADHKINSDDFTMGMKFLLSGFIKKVVIADTLGIFVDLVFANIATTNGLALALSGIFFYIQLFCDFSGYSDIATGAARLMGVKLMKNFGRVFNVTSFSEIWENWHISLGSWFNDYVYTPLNYSAIRSGKHLKFKLYLNIFIVMLISGLWHGANWTYIISGVGVSFLIIGERLLAPKMKKFAKKINLNLKSFGYTTFKKVLIFVVSGVYLILFRSQSIQEGLFAYGKIFTDFLGGGLSNTISTMDLTWGKAILIILVIALVPFLPYIVEENTTDRHNELFSLKNACFFAGIVVICFAWFMLISSDAQSVFVYFQF